QASQQALKLMPPNEPLASVTFDAVGIAAVLRRIETNGHHVTWAAWDSTDRKSITTKHGMIVATRSLVQDLMSAEADGVLALVRGRHAGTTPYALRYIDGNYDTIEEAYTCRVSRGTEQAVKLANGVVVPAVEMVSECSSQSRQFVDRFMVDRSGRIVQMRQWVGPVLGFADMALLR
ncbi:MAG: YjbF family lipoprotein, partial [Pseudomonadota bacterium]